MFNFNQEQVQAVLAQLDLAIYNHEQWYGSLNRTLICRLPYDRRDVHRDAHRECRFGQWFYLSAPQDFRDTPACAAIDVAHARMHELAARLLRTAAAGNAVSPLEYDDFANTLERLRLEIHTLKRELQDSLFNLDTLTGTQSRIGMLTRLREQQELVKRQAQSCSIAMMDLDHFKAINDTYGHQAGDRVLADAAHYVIEHLRPYDRVFRYGGEEFLICMQNADLKTSHELVERLREGLAASAIRRNGEEPIRTTASFGLTLLDPDVFVEQSVDRADKAMYAAKAAGRNCVRVWDPSM